MSGSTGQTGPASLDADGVIRFRDADHFLEELAGNLGRGRAFVRTEQSVPLNSRLELALEAPDGAGRLPLQAMAVFVRQGFVGLELVDFESQLVALDDLGRKVERAADGRQDAGAAQVHFDDEDEADTGPLDHPPVRAHTPLPLPSDAFEPAGAEPGPMSPVDDLTAALSEYLQGDDAPAPDASDLPEPPARVARSRDDTLVGPPPGAPSHIPAAVTALDIVPKPTSEEPMERSAPLSDPAEAVQPTDAPSVAPAPEDAPQFAPDPIATMATRVPNFAELEAAAAATSVEDTDALSPEAEPAESTHPEAASESTDAAESPAEPTPAFKLPSPAALSADLLPEPPGIPHFNLEGLADAPFPRASAGGALRLSSPAQLLGLWLAGLSEGWLTVNGGPEGEPGDDFRLKFVAGRVLTVDAEIVARAGPWLTVKTRGTAEIREFIVDNAESWQEAVQDLGGVAPSNEALAPPVVTAPPIDAAPITPPSPLAPDPTSTPSAPALSESAPGVPLSNPSLVMGPLSSNVVGVATPRFLPEPENPNEPPRAPRLDGDTVCFRHAVDLRREVDVDIANGGLFAEASPLPIQTRKQLRIRVADIDLPVTLTAEVVFADDGKVGFSVLHADEACRELEAILTDGLPQDAEAPRPVPITGDLVAPPSPEETPEAIEDSVLTTGGTGTLRPPPSPEGLLDLEAARTGDLEAVDTPSAVALFDELVSGRFKGVLHLRTASAERKIFFHEGNVAYLEALPFDELTALGRILATHKRISEAALRTGLSKAKKAQRPLGRSLVSLGFAKSGDIVSALREQTRSRIEQSFSWHEGSYLLGPWQDPPGKGELIVTRGLGILTQHIRNRFEALNMAEMERLLGPRFEDRLRQDAGLEAAISTLGLGPKETRFLQVSMDGRRSLEEAIKISPVPKLASLRLAALAFSLGLVHKEASGAPPERRGTSTSATSKMRRELRKSLELLEGQNHFEVLGVHWSSHHRTFRTAYEATLAEFSVAKGKYAKAPAEVQALARQAAARVKQAFEVIGNETRRVSYRKELFDQTEREYSAQMLVEKGEVALMRGDRVTAIEHLETAVELHPTDRNRSLLRAAREGRQ